MIRLCHGCGEEMEVPRGPGRPPKFCSDECRAIGSPSCEGMDIWAGELRAEGLKYREIAALLGESTSTVHRRCNRERDRALQKIQRKKHAAQRREYDLRYRHEHRAVCPKCGYVYAPGSGTKRGAAKHVDFTNCSGCAEQRRQNIVRWWAEGLTMAEISNRLGWRGPHLNVEMVRMRRDGYDLPYRRPNAQPVFPEQVAA